MTRIRPNSLYGTVDMLLLRTLSRIGPAHGLGISEEVRTLSDDRLVLEEGAVYPALHRLEKAGLIRGAWKISEKRRRARFYALTPRGRRELERQMEDWLAHIEAVRRVLDIAGEEA